MGFVEINDILCRTKMLSVEMNENLVTARLVARNSHFDVDFHLGFILRYVCPHLVSKSTP